MNALEKLTEVASSIENSYLADWKEQGKKVVGYVCSYMPEEILFAGGLLPFRISGRGAGDTSQADAYLSRVNCSFARCCLEQGFQGKYDFLDGAVWVNGCDHIRRCYDNWKAKIPMPFMHMLPVPHKIFPDGRQWFKEEVEQLVAAVETHFKTSISDAGLKEACSVYNETRTLLRRLYDLQAGAAPILSGAQVSAVLTASVCMPKPEFNRLLAELLEEAGGGEAAPGAKKRLMVVGSMMDDPLFIQNIEDLGAVVVTDALCIGTRSFWHPVAEDGDLFENLVDRYYLHPPCPRMAGSYDLRLEFIRDQIERAGVDGVILEFIKFCDLHGTENALLKRDLEESGVATLELERQYGPLADAGRIRTRVQAFLERIGS